MSDIREKITFILTNKIGLAKSKVTPEADFIRDLGVDSLDYVEIMMEFEQVFNIKIPDEDVKSLQTVGQAEEYIRLKRQLG